MLAKTRYKIAKKVHEHHRKVKKQARKNNRKKQKIKDSGIPNSLPFKSQVIEEIRNIKRKEDHVRKANRAELKEIRQSNREKEIFKLRGIECSNRFESLKEKILEAASAKAAQAKPHQEATSTASVSNIKHFYKEFKKVIETADVIIEVLDARDPLATRSAEIEECVAKSGSNKKLVLLLNKCDLIPQENLEKWLKYLRNDYPTIAFKASTQKQKNKLSRKKQSVLSTTEAMLTCSRCFGANDVLELLKNYCRYVNLTFWCNLITIHYLCINFRNDGIMTSINVGVVGFPNVGKSSVINSLKCSRACNVGAVPGLTKTLQLVNLDKNIKLLDCPGIVYANVDKFQEETQGDDKKLKSVIALRNALSIDQLEDPIGPVEAILEKVSKNNILLLYGIPDFDDVEKFLAHIARRFGLIKKGGIPEINGAAKRVLNDWNTGKIKYFTEPPQSTNRATIVSQMQTN